jgi:SAM-dependent methyltransferase
MKEVDDNAAFIAGDILQPPFKPDVFSTILMTEVLEHLIDPDKGVKNCYDLLEEGGIAVISVPSLHNINYSINPFRLLEKTLSLFNDRILPPYHHLHATREYNWRKPEPEYGIHFNFSRQQLKSVFEKNGFHILWQGSFEIEVMPYLFLEYIAGEDVDWIRQTVRPIEKFLTKVPIINALGQHLLIVVQKRNT